MNNPPASNRQEVIYRIDREDRIIYTNDDFTLFAEVNRAPGLSREAVLGKSLWDYICDRETRSLHVAILDKVRESGRTFSFPFRCDAPDRRRFLEMILSPGPDGAVDYSCRLIREEVRPPVALLSTPAGPSKVFLRMCSWCKKVEVPDKKWAEVEEAIKALGLFESPVVPAITHGICPTCFEEVMEKLKSSIES